MSNNDNIEGTFRDSFNPDNITNQGWNEPSDNVWGKIEDDLVKRNRSFFGFPFFMLASGLLILLMGVGYLMNQNNNLAKQVNEIKLELENCGSQNRDKKNIVLPQAKRQSLEVFSSLGDFDKSKITETVAIQTEETEITKNIKSVNDAEKLNSTLETIFQPNEIVPAGSLESLFNYDGILQPNEISKVDKVVAINNGRQILFLEELHQQESYLISRKLNITILQPNVAAPITDIKPKYFVSLSGGIIGSSLVSKGSQATALVELIDREYAKLGSIIEVKYTSAISKKWSLGAGLGLSNQEFITEYDISLPYQVGDERIENGSGYIDFEHSLPTSFGNMDTELRLRRPNADLPLEEKNVNIDFDIKHRFLKLTAPLSIDYLGKDLISGFYFGLDLVPSYIISARSGISSVVSQHSKIESVNNGSTSDYNDLQKVNLALGSHLGYRYPITLKSGLEFNVKYLRNLNSYFSSDSFSSQSHGLQFSGGYFFRF